MKVLLANLWFGTASLAACFVGYSLQAATLENCDEGGLRAALAAGGTVTFGCDAVITLTSPITIRANTILDGNGHSVTLSGGGAVRLLDVLSGVTLGLVNLTLANGRATGPEEGMGFPGQPGQGGALRVLGGDFWASNCRFVENKAVGGRGGNADGFFVISPGPGGAGEGGAIFAPFSSLRLTNCVFESNAAEGGKGGSAFPQGGIIRFGGAGGISRGGAIFALFSKLEFQNTTLENNHAIRGLEGDGSFSGDFPSTIGGAIYSETCTGTFAHCTWRNNGAATGGGASFNLAGDITFSACTFENNSVGPSLVSQGGAIQSVNNQLSLEGCIFQNNSAQGSGAFAIRSIGRYGGAADGAAVNSVGGPLTVTGCAFVANRAQGGYGMFVGIPLGVLSAGSGRGAAIFNDGSATVVNSTFVNNVARAGDSQGPDGSGGRGGAFASIGGNATLSFSTIASNFVGDNITLMVSSQGAGCYLAGGTLTLDNSILAGNVADTGGSYGVSANAYGAILDGGHNLSSDPTPAFTTPASRNDIDPRLGLLTYTSAAVATLPLLPGSPAIDAADDVKCPATDQRGVTRPAMVRCDIGAYEFWPESFIFTSIMTGVGSNVFLQGTGVPGQTFRLQAASNLVGDWEDIASATVLPSGLFQITTTNGNARAFYRTVAP